jgi:hypothetical protein
MRKYSNSAALLAASSVFGLCLANPALAQESKNTKTDKTRVEQLTREVEDLRAMVQELRQRMPAPASNPAATAETTPVAPAAAMAAPAPALMASPMPVAAVQPAAPEAPAAMPPEAHGSKGIVADLLKGVTINGLLDTYYEYNTNKPIGRINLLRAYDVSSNNFSLNQADLLIESAPDPANGKPFGLRFDLQYGQATATLQGNPANELRPELYRPIYQAFGTYVVPVGNGLNVDFGKWASSLGMEGNYTKDQFNYSRSYWFNYLPFYHTGLRMKYPVNDELTLSLWITNGTQQTEAFNDFKDQMYGLAWTPASNFSWTFNYYRGQEHPDVTYLTRNNTGLNLPSQQGSFVEPIANPATGLLNIGDTYAAWQVNEKLTLAAEADYVEQRFFSNSKPDHVYGGALYAAYQITPKLSLAARGEYLADRGGLFSGQTQNLKDMTFTLGYRPAGDGFLFDLEYRHDFSDKPYFLTSTLGNLVKDQPTIGFGVTWWFGQKQGAW